MADNSFIESIQLGDMAQLFAEKYKGFITGFGWVPNINTDGLDLIEGADNYGLAFATQGNDPTLHAGSCNIEIKGNFDCKMLSFYKYGKKEMPTVEFELWSNCQSGTKGWLYALLHPDEHNQNRAELNRRERATSCGMLIFVCFWTDDKGIKRPYMTLTMRKFDAVLERLKRYASEEYHWDLEQWNIPSPSNKEYWKPFHDKCIVRGNTWNVPLDVLLEAGNIYIVMFDDKPANLDDEQSMRYKKFCELANGRHYYTSQIDNRVKEVNAQALQDQDTPLRVTPEEAYDQTIAQMEETIAQYRRPLDE